MKSLRDRELLGRSASRRASGIIMGRHLFQFLRPSRNLELKASPQQRGPVLCLDIEASGRFMLTGALDCSVSLWDLEKRGTDGDEHVRAALQAGRAPPAAGHVSRHWDPDEGWVKEPRSVLPICIATRGCASNGGLHPHTFAVTSVQWYPVRLIRARVFSFLSLLAFADAIFGCFLLG